MATFEERTAEILRLLGENKDYRTGAEEAAEICQTQQSAILEAVAQVEKARARLDRSTADLKELEDKIGANLTRIQTLSNEVSGVSNEKTTLERKQKPNGSHASPRPLKKRQVAKSGSKDGSRPENTEDLSDPSDPSDDDVHSVRAVSTKPTIWSDPGDLTAAIQKKRDGQNAADRQRAAKRQSYDLKAAITCRVANIVDGKPMKNRGVKRRFPENHMLFDILDLLHYLANMSTSNSAGSYRLRSLLKKVDRSDLSGLLILLREYKASQESAGRDTNDQEEMWKKINVEKGEKVEEKCGDENRASVNEDDAEKMKIANNAETAENAGKEDE